MVYALKNFLEKLPVITEPKTTKEKNERIHARIQGMLLEIGNNRKGIPDTYTHDKKWLFENKLLGSLSTLQKVPLFTFKHI